MRPAVLVPPSLQTGVRTHLPTTSIWCARMPRPPPTPHCVRVHTDALPLCCTGPSPGARRSSRACRLEVQEVLRCERRALAQPIARPHCTAPHCSTLRGLTHDQPCLPCKPHRCETMPSEPMCTLVLRHTLACSLHASWQSAVAPPAIVTAHHRHRRTAPHRTALLHATARAPSSRPSASFARPRACSHRVRATRACLLPVRANVDPVPMCTGV